MPRSLRFTLFATLPQPLLGQIMRVLNSILVLVTMAAAFCDSHVGSAAEFRVWRDVTGNHSVEAKLVSTDSKAVKLLRRDGKTFDVPIRRLSEADRAFLTALPATTLPSFESSRQLNTLRAENTVMRAELSALKQELRRLKAQLSQAPLKNVTVSPTAPQQTPVRTSAVVGNSVQEQRVSADTDAQSGSTVGGHVPTATLAAPVNRTATLPNDSRAEDVVFVDKLTDLIIKEINPNTRVIKKIDPNTRPELLDLERRCRVVANAFSKQLGQPHRTKASPTEAVDACLAGYSEMLSRKRPADGEAFDRLSRPEKMKAVMRAYEQWTSVYDINDLPPKPAITHDAAPADLKFIDDMATLVLSKTLPNVSLSSLDLDARCRVMANAMCEPLGWPRHSKISPTEAVDVFLAGFAVLLSQDDPALGKDFENLSRPEKMQVAKELFGKAMQDIDTHGLTDSSK